ncbi:helix-turn-helix transcriptional regulator [Pelomonas sp. KK5]|uniref:helix-turn-helix transcriptional regulator n=1 Tax=Pelomonas sp. KK5 TaxID=1855730 RepID=UPI00097C50A0|nr:helix-turn-helix transcriptional regulator [Pelomonas sp. KK5]
MAPLLPPAGSPPIAQFAARLIDTLDSDRLLAELADGLRARLDFTNLIVFAYRQGFAADLVFTNLDIDRLRKQMEPYTSGLFMLDPFYIADMTEGRHGVLTFAGVTPEAFKDSEFFLAFYNGVNVLDELHFVVPLAPGRSVHVFVEREAPLEKFTTDEIAGLESLEPMVRSAIQRHWAWRDRAQADATASPIQSAGGIDGVIRNMKPGQLTPREIEVIGLSLRGHSSKLIAHELSISEGTVTNHKRNVYEKLEIHSQSQLFSLFLSTLAGQAA